jgi:hypothetical protein
MASMWQDGRFSLYYGNIFEGDTITTALVMVRLLEQL